jgi:hypothetical protein
MKQKTAQYMAGLFDAEGCLTINSSFRKLSNCQGYTAQIIFTNTNLQLMKWIVTNFGGVYKSRKMVTGCIQAYDWKVTNQKHALSFISTIEPYLIVKKQEAQLMMQYYALDGVENPEARKFLCDSIKVLKWNRGSVTTDMSNASNVSNAYFAGFVDGDGSISTTPKLYAGNTHKGVIQMFVEKYGGCYTVRDLNSKNKNWNQEHKWSLHNREKVADVLLCWLPYLIDKRERALLGLNKIRGAKIQSELIGDYESDLMGTSES